MFIPVVMTRVSKSQHPLKLLLQLDGLRFDKIVPLMNQTFHNLSCLKCQWEYLHLSKLFSFANLHFHE